MSFQDNLKKYRLAAGYQQAKDFALLIGLKCSTYTNYEAGNREPKYEKLCKIAAALHVTTDELLGYDGESIWRKKYEEAQRQLDAIREILGDEH